MPKEWRASAIAEIRDMVYERNAIAKIMSKDIKDNKAIEIPYLSSNAVISSIATKRDYENQKRALEAFLSSDLSIEEHGKIRIPTPLLNEVKSRVAFSNKDVDIEANYGKRISKAANISGVPAPNIAMGNARIATRKLSEREPDEYRGNYDYSKFVNRVFERTASSKNAHKWELYKKNYIKALRKTKYGIASALDASYSEKKELRKKYKEALSKLSKISTEKFRKIYYQDLSGDIDYLTYYESAEIGDFSSRIEDVSAMFGLGLFDSD